MLRITVELVPHGMETFKTTIGTFEVTNEGKSLNENLYDYTLTSEYDNGHYTSETIIGIDRAQRLPWFLRDLFKKACF